MTPFFVITGIFVCLILAAVFCEMQDRKTKKEALAKVSDIKPSIEPPKKDISEPVLSFVETVRENPKRFKGDRTKCGEFIFKDKETKESWTITRNTYCYSETVYSGLDCLTQDEYVYLFVEITKVYNKRKERYTQIKNERERKRLMKIYCKPQQENV